MRVRRSSRLSRKGVVALMAAGLLLAGVVAIAGSASAGPDDAGEAAEEQAGAPEESAEEPAEQEAEAPEEPDDAEPAPQQEEMAAQERTGIRVVIDIEGVSLVAKMGSEINVGPGRFEGAIYSNPDEEWDDIEGELTLPPSDGYFVVFGFMPTTSTVDFAVDNPVRGKMWDLDVVGGTAYVEMDVEMFIEVSDVKQDGVPLHVGGGCRTDARAVIPIEGEVNIIPGAKTELRSSYEIPRFAGCGAAEDLDPLITGLVSGPGNIIDNTLTMRCLANNCVDG